VPVSTVVVLEAWLQGPSRTPFGGLGFGIGFGNTGLGFGLEEKVLALALDR